MASALRAHVDETDGLEVDALGDPAEHASPVAVDAVPHDLAHEAADLLDGDPVELDHAHRHLVPAEPPAPARRSTAGGDAVVGSVEIVRLTLTVGRAFQRIPGRFPRATTFAMLFCFIPPGRLTKLGCALPRVGEGVRKSLSIGMLVLISTSGGERRRTCFTFITWK